MTNTDDKLSPEERAEVERLRNEHTQYAGILFNGNADLSGNTRKGLLALLDRLAPKPIALVEFWEALRDMQADPTAVYTAIGMHPHKISEFGLQFQLYDMTWGKSYAPIDLLLSKKWNKVS